MSLALYDDILRNEIEVLSAVFDKEFSYEIRDHSVKLIFNLPTDSIKFNYNNFIHLQLYVICEVNYPNSVPEVIFSNFWGLDDSDIDDLYKIIRLYLKNNISEPEGLVFNIIQKINDYVDHNTPKVRCSICLDYFTDPSEVYVTTSHHYFHQICIENYAAYQLNEYKELVAEAKQNNRFINENELPKLNIKCPLCKSEDLSFDSTPQNDLATWQIKSNEQEKQFLSEEIISQMKKMTLDRDRQIIAVKEKELYEAEKQKRVEMSEQSKMTEKRADIHTRGRGWRRRNSADNRRMLNYDRGGPGYFNAQSRNYHRNQYDFTPPGY